MKGSIIGLILISKTVWTPSQKPSMSLCFYSLTYLRRVDYFPQWPHQSTVHSHQLLSLYLVGLVKHNSGENNRRKQCWFWLQATHINIAWMPKKEKRKIFGVNLRIPQYLILSSWFFRAFITSENSSEMSSLWASNSKMILSTRSANHSRTAAKS